MQPAIGSKDLSEREVLCIDPLVEYEIRRYMRALADRWLEKTNDESSVIVELGRPTGP